MNTGAGKQNAAACFLDHIDVPVVEIVYKLLTLRISSLCQRLRSARATASSFSATIDGASCR
jgi:hypothetical protein